MYPETRKLVADWYRRDNCQSQSEFIEKAIKFYCGYISAEEGVRYLPAAITSAMTGMVDGMENRMARLIFKLAVEISMMMNVLASTADVDEATLRRLRDYLQVPISEKRGGARGKSGDLCGDA
jgi:hypothetical protein